MGQSFDFFLAAASLIVGIMLLTGHGDIFLSNGKNQPKQKRYDEKKLAKSSGIMLILIGVITFIDSYTTALIFKVLYLAAVAVILIWFVWYLKTKCTK